MNLKLEHQKPDLSKLTRLDYFSNNSIETYIDCNRKGWFQYYFNLDSGTTASMSAGTVIHAAIEHFHKTRDQNAAARVLARTYEAEGAAIKSGPTRLTLPNLTQVFDAYVARYAQDQIEHLAQEFDFYVWFPGTCLSTDAGKCDCDQQDPHRCFWFIGRCDGIVRFSGDIYVHEIKTTGTINADYLKSLDLARQSCSYVFPIQYILTGNADPHRVRGVLYDILGIAVTKREMTRFPVLKNEKDHNEWLGELREAVARFRMEKDSLLLPMRNTKQCTRYGKCAFIPLCESMAGWTKDNGLSPLARNFPQRSRR